MEQEIREKTIFLMKQFCELRNILDESDLKVKIFEQGFRLQGVYIESEWWDFYNLDIFLERYLSYEVIENYDVITDDIKFELGQRKKLIELYGEKVYSKQGLKEVKKQLLEIKKLWSREVNEKYLIKEKKENFDVENFLEDYINDKNYKVINIVKGKIINLYKHKNKIIDELIWIKENNQKSEFEILILSEDLKGYIENPNESMSCAWSVKMQEKFIKISIVGYIKETGNVERRHTLTKENLLKKFLNKYKVKNF
ncbi:MAG: hypothetical protein ACRCTZ_18445 [Sarcina sp.]